MEYIIDLKRPSGKDELRCADGEVEGGEWLFEENSEGSVGDNESDRRGLTLEIPTTVEAQEKILCLHSIEGDTDRINAIVQTTNLELYFITAGGTPKHTAIEWKDRLPVKRCCAAGDYLVLLTDVGLSYSRWERGDGVYTAVEKAPGIPSAAIGWRPKALPPYSFTDTESPVLEIGVELGEEEGDGVIAWLDGRMVSTCGEDVKKRVREAVKARIERFLLDVMNAGYHLVPCYCSASWETADGRCWQESSAEQVGDNAPLEITVTAASYNAGVLGLRVSLSLMPREIVTESEKQFGGLWEKEIKGVKIINRGEAAEIATDMMTDLVWIDSRRRGFVMNLRALPIAGAEEEILPKIDSEGVPDDIQSLGNRLHLIYRSRDRRASNYISVSESGLPFLGTGIHAISGKRLIRVSQSLRSLSSGQLGEFPAYAFSGDGVRALTPRDGSYSDVQLISRDVILSEQSAAPMPDGIGFLTCQGVMYLSGASVSNIGSCGRLGREFTPAHRLAYHYGLNTLILYRPGDSEILLYDCERKTWTETVFDEASLLLAHYYAWPEIYIRTGNGLGRVVPAEEERRVSVKGASGIGIRTRPLKFGKPFAIKKLEQIEALWADGSRNEIAVYGALKTDIWHFLGRNSTGNMRLRGSGWRFYKIETVVRRKTDEKGWIIPLIRCKIKDE